MKILAYLGALAVLLAVGFTAGWHAKGNSLAAADDHAAHQELADTKADFQQQITYHTAALQKQIDDTTALDATQALTRAAAVDIHLEIDHAAFPPALPGQCPDPVGSTEFVRLYNAAAAGHAKDPAAAPAR